MKYSQRLIERVMNGESPSKVSIKLKDGRIIKAGPDEVRLADAVAKKLTILRNR